MKISILNGFDNSTAAALVAGAALDFDRPYNAPADFTVPNEQEIRAEILRWAHEAIGVPEGTNDPVSRERVSDLLDEEFERLMLADTVVPSS